MGIHAKYNLTRYMYQNKEPKTFYSCDKYIVTVSSHTYDLEHVHEYDSWEDVRNYVDRISNDRLYDDYGFSVVGLVFD